MRKYTLQEALEQVDYLGREVASLLAVAAIDMRDVHGDERIPEALFNANADVHTGEFKPTEEGLRFARLLVERIVFSDEMVFEVRAVDTEGSA